ncbi:putative F-box protein At3g52320 [Capsella rubella]|uniref:putative F-box protein At3g52320 n=1 Tax=Capsella rubella TaxID=81985 RepID=UPI000CD53637|nr:putative F-box protein At3g52320 [Capsella rubella]
MCFRVGRVIRICNLTTMQLAMLNTVCEVSEEEGVVRSEHQVLVLGPGAYWRNTQSNIPPPPHRPCTQRLSINGVFYYGARIDKNTCVLMSFDLTSEDFSLIELPIEASIVWDRHRANIMIYQGKAAVFEYSRLVTGCILDLWVVEDAGKSEWSHKAFVLPIQLLMQSLCFDELLMHHTGRSGELRLSGARFDGNKVSMHAIYDLERKCVSRGVVVGPLYAKFHGFESLEIALWDDVESIMYLKT